MTTRRNPARLAFVTPVHRRGPWPWVSGRLGQSQGLKQAADSRGQPVPNLGSRAQPGATGAAQHAPLGAQEAQPPSVHRRLALLPGLWKQPARPQLRLTPGHRSVPWCHCDNKGDVPRQQTLHPSPESWGRGRSPAASDPQWPGPQRKGSASCLRVLLCSGLTRPSPPSSLPAVGRETPVLWGLPVSEPGPASWPGAPAQAGDVPPHALQSVPSSSWTPAPRTH